MNPIRVGRESGCIRRRVSDRPCGSAVLFLTLFSIVVPLLAVAQAAELRVAVASNFHRTLAEIGAGFEAATGHRLLLSSGSTGRHYAQIRHGAPFDLFFAADRERPERLDREGLSIVGTRFTYALGRLVLWSPQSGRVDPSGDVLSSGGFRHLAIANPRLAPYGRAAQQFLQHRGLWRAIVPRLVRGENIGQTFQFVASGNAELGLVAYSQLRRGGEIQGSWWLVPPDLHESIEQQAVLLKDSPAGRALMAYVQGPGGQVIIQRHGYTRPGRFAAPDLGPGASAERRP